MITRKKDVKIEKVSGEEDSGDGEDKVDRKDAQAAAQDKDNYKEELQESWRGDNKWKDRIKYELCEPGLNPISNFFTHRLNFLQMPMLKKHFEKKYVCAKIPAA
jgi:hypothetical protein